MSYSRQQLYAFGEPLGDSVTRKEGGRIVYGDGGGSAPSSTTQVSELPEWARGYAKDTLSKAGALTDVNKNPYQAYGGNRIAGFSPLQQQAQQQAAGMQTSGLTGMGAQMAGAAGLGALGANYDPTQFQAGQFGGKEAQQYMSPYMQNVVDIQQREAQRQGDIAGTQRAAQATGAGAFGGSRQAIMDAEAARNLATQKGDIQAQGLQSSYQQAQNQFNADQARQMQAQQLGEQSKQYGAGYGMQGLQTALQGAGQLGALGQQQFGQGMDINKLLSAYGGQQQELQQRGLTQGYQDFLNQQNYPYKQLGFMSDMIRGLPLGQQSTSQMYEAPGSITGQIAGLGTGMLGLSKFMAEGGSVNSYADGGSVDSQQNVANIVGQLSNEQLKQALKAAQARADMDQIEAIQREMAERASMSRGLASIPMDHAAMMPDEVVGAANGGIVAFAGGESVKDDALDEEARQDREAIKKGWEATKSLGSVGRAGLSDLLSFPVRGTAKAIDTAVIRPLRAAGIDASKIAPLMAGEGENPKDWFPALSKEFKGSGEKAKPAPAATAAPVAKAEEKKAAPAVKAAVKEATSPASISQAVDKIAEETGKPKQTLMEQYKEIEKSLSSNNQATTDILKNAEEKLAGRAEEIKGRGLGEALMAFGFGMAEKASRPGAKFFGSAAAASPAISQAVAENQKLQMAAQDNLAKMQIDRAKYEQAMQKQDSVAATQLLAQLRQGEHQDAVLQEQIAQNKRSNAIQQQQVGISAAHLAQSGTPEVFKIADQLKARGYKGTDEEIMAEAERLKNSGITERVEGANAGKVAANVATLLGKDTEHILLKSQLLGAKTDADRAKIQQKIDAIEAKTEAAVRQRMSLASRAGSVAAPSFAGYSMVGETPNS
jgi:hypothetical protein